MSSAKITIQDWINLVKKELHALYPAEELRSFQNLAFEHYLKYSPTQVYLNQNELLSSDVLQELEGILNGLKKQEPIQYLLGQTEFYDLPFSVNNHVLIPRPETEELVRLIVEDVKIHQARILDIGTGSGCIAISLAKYIENSQVSAMDVSAEALAVAKQNAIKNKVDVQFLLDDILNPSMRTETLLDVIVSNPPYVRELEREQMQYNVLDNEPHLALFVDDYDALKFYRAICQFASAHLKKGGSLYFEINEAFGKETAELMKSFGISNVEIRKDLFGKDRMAKGVYAGQS